jgi:hypothetical protein
MALNMGKNYYFMKSLTDDATWTDVFYDMAAAVASVIAGMIVYILVVWHQALEAFLMQDNFSRPPAAYGHLECVYTLCATTMLVVGHCQAYPGADAVEPRRSTD